MPVVKSTAVMDFLLMDKLSGSHALAMQLLALHSHSQSVTHLSVCLLLDVQHSSRISRIERVLTSAGVHEYLREEHVQSDALDGTKATV